MASAFDTTEGHLPNGWAILVGLGVLPMDLQSGPNAEAISISVAPKVSRSSFLLGSSGRLVGYSDGSSQASGNGTKSSKVLGDSMESPGGG